MKFEEDIENCLLTLKSGGLILYPTDTIWGIGCDATNAQAVDKIFKLKRRPERKSMVVLVGSERDVLRHAAHVHPAVFDYLQTVTKPTTVIYEGALGLADNLVAEDGSIAMRIVTDEFCRHLVRRFRKPVVSTSANISGESAAQLFSRISPEILNGVDYIVSHRRNETVPASASAIVRYNSTGKLTVLRS